MTSFHGHETGAMLDAYDFTGIKVLVDVGRGNGSLLIDLLRRYPEMNGILYDLGHVAGRARDALRSAGLDGRCSVQEGSFFDSIPSGADAYLMRHVIHDWTDEQSIQILSNCRKVIAANGASCWSNSMCRPRTRRSSAKDADIIMLAFPGGMERTEVEYGELFDRSGFRLSKVTPTKFAVSVYEAKPV